MDGKILQKDTVKAQPQTISWEKKRKKEKKKKRKRDRVEISKTLRGKKKGNLYRKWKERNIPKQEYKLAFRNCKNCVRKDKTQNELRFLVILSLFFG